MLGDQSPDDNDNLLERDLVYKRSQLYGELMRKLSNECFQACAMHLTQSGKKVMNDAENVDLNPQEEKCIAKCEKKV